MTSITNVDGCFLTPVNDAYKYAIEQVSQLANQASGTVVNDETSFQVITHCYSKAREWENIIEKRRKEIIDPFQAQIKQVNDHAKKLTGHLDAVRDIANYKAGAYYNKISEAVELFGENEDIRPKGKGANLSVRRKKEFKISDLDAIPRKYLCVDERKVQADIEAGILKIEGIEIYETKKTTLRIDNE